MNFNKFLLEDVLKRSARRDSHLRRMGNGESSTLDLARNRMEREYNSLSSDLCFHDAQEVCEDDADVAASRTSTTQDFPSNHVPHHLHANASFHSSPNETSMLSSILNATNSCQTMVTHPPTDMEMLCRNAELLAATLNNLCEAISRNTWQHQQELQHARTTPSQSQSHHHSHSESSLNPDTKKVHISSKSSHSHRRGAKKSSPAKTSGPSSQRRASQSPHKKLISPPLFPPLHSDDEHEGDHSHILELPFVDDSSWKRSDKVIVELRMVFLKIGEIDTLKEIYHAEIFTQAKWREPKLDHRRPEELLNMDLQSFWNPSLTIDNILTESKEQHWLTAVCNERGEAYLVERRKIKGVFLETLELNDFPLDVQDLTVTMTSERPDTEVDLVPDTIEQSGINLKTFVDQQEWKLHEHIEITKRSVAQEYSTSMKSHPFLSVTCRASRRPGYFYWNVFLIMFFITSLSFATFSLPPEKPENRLQLSFTLFLTSVAFKFVINQSLPKISYLTYMDKYVLMSLVILCAISIWHATVTLIPVNIPPLQQLTTASNSTSVTSWSTMFPTSTMLAPILFHNHSTVPTAPSTSVTTTLAPQVSSTSSAASRRGRMKKLLEIKANFLRRMERDFLASFMILYILAHLIFGFWLYFDACKRRREMKEKDRQYKKEIHCTDV